MIFSKNFFLQKFGKKQTLIFLSNIEMIFDKNNVFVAEENCLA